jgi:hypothetical protein
MEKAVVPSTLEFEWPQPEFHFMGGNQFQLMGVCSLLTHDWNGSSRHGDDPKEVRLNQGAESL